MYFFVFKQKTAYEMRISDWSSDVCSADLLVDHVIYHSGLLAHYQNERDGVDRLENLQELVNAAQMFVSDENFDGMPAGRIPDIGASPGGPDPDLPLSDPASAGAGHDGASVVSEPRDRKSVVSGKSVSVRVDLGGRRIIKKKKKQKKVI